MAITTTVRPRYAFQMIFMFVLCLVLGLWGTWDYFVKIPNQQRAYERFRVCEAVRDAIDLHTSASTDPAAREQQTREALELVNTRIESLLARESDIEEVNLNPTNSAAREQQMQQLQQAVESLRGGAQEQWLSVLALFQAALQNPPPLDQPLSGVHQAAWQLAGEGLSAFDDVEPPSRLDRATQILFILCLLGVPWTLWSFVRTKSQVYRLEEDGTLVMPEGTFAKDDIVDIDMERWMKKSIAYVVMRDGRRVKIDDYLYKNAHLIVGAIASEFYPEQWTEDARMVKPDVPADSEGAAGASESAEGVDATGDAAVEASGPEQVESEEAAEHRTSGTSQ